MISSKRIFTQALAAAALLAASQLSGISGAVAQTTELKFTSYVGPAHGHHKRVLEPWAKMVEEKGGGKLKVTIFPGTLGKQADQLEMIQTGIADMGYFVPALTPGRFPLTSVAELPFLFKTGKGGSRALNELWNKHLQKEGTAADLKVLWTFIHPAGQLHMSKKQVTKMEDLNGLRIRTAPGVQQNATALLGATPVVVPFPETYNALDRGILDGVWFPWEAIAGVKLFEVTKFHTNANFYTVPFIVAMNQKKWATLSAEQKKVFEELGGNWAAEFTGAAWDKNDEDGIEAAKKVNSTIVTLSDAERARWADKVKPLENTWLADMKAKNLPGDVVLSDLRELIKKYDP